MQKNAFMAVSNFKIVLAIAIWSIVHITNRTIYLVICLKLRSKFHDLNKLISSVLKNLNRLVCLILLPCNAKNLNVEKQHWFG